MKVEILAPVGSWESLHSAIKGGADCIYFGIDKLNMRSRSSINFTVDDVPKIIEICGSVRTYVTLNTVMYNEDLPLVREICDALKQSGISAVIASDMAVIQYARSIDLPVHISTQLNVCNIEAVRFYSQFADVIVLAREVRLEHIKEISETIKKENICGPNGNLVKIEVFVHGALCVAISGKCYMSLAQHNQSANRGACYQVCRRKYRVIDEESGKELSIDNKYIMSPKDLCTIGCLDELIDAGISVLKIEGRGRSANYVYTVTKTYKEASQNYSKDKVNEWKETLSTVYNRGFWENGYYLGKELGEWCGNYGSQATKKRTYIGKVTNYFSKLQVAEVKIEAGSIKDGDEILFTGNSTGVVESVAQSIRVADHQGHAKQGDMMTLPISERVRRNDKLFIITDR
jgi:U32 family peptidase